jgi:ankyrin repeat protein
VNARNNSEDYYSKRQTSLIYAASNRDINILNVLLEKGADVNAQNGYGYSALIMAAAKGHLDQVKSLLAKGADVNLKNDKGRTALDEAERNNYFEIARILSVHKIKTSNK